MENGDVSLISVSLQRRNAIDVSDGEILPERRQKKSSSGIVFSKFHLSKTPLSYFLSLFKSFLGNSPNIV